MCSQRRRKTRTSASKSATIRKPIISFAARPLIAGAQWTRGPPFGDPQAFCRVAGLTVAQPDQIYQRHKREDCPPSAAASSMQDIRHGYCHYDDQQEWHTKRHHPMPFGRHRIAKPKLVAIEFHFFLPTFCDFRWACTTKPVMHNGRASLMGRIERFIFRRASVYFVSDLRDDVGARGFL